MYTLILLALLGCPKHEGPVVARAPLAAPAPPPAPPPLPPLPPSGGECPAEPLHSWSALTGPRRVAGVVTFPGVAPEGGLYEVLPAEPFVDGEWIKITTAAVGQARAAPDGTPEALEIRRSDLELAPTRRVVLGEGPGVPGSDSPRVELAPGARIRVIEARSGQLHVATVGGRLTAEGWIDTASVGVGWRPCRYAPPAPNRFLAPSAPPVSVRDRPGGRVLAELSGTTNVLAVASDAPPGWVRVVAASPTVWVDGYVPAETLMVPGG